MQPVKQLVRVKHGSHLYGTSTPASDQDFKGVHLPSGEAIILQRAENVIDTGVKSKVEGTDKNDADAIDSQSFSVQKFFEMLMKGDTVATEVLFAPPEAIVEQHPDWITVRAIGIQLLNRQCKGFVGYCVRQAAKYGIKGSRMNAVKKVVDFLNTAFQEHKGEKLEKVRQELYAMSFEQENMGWENIPHPDGRACWHFVCCDRKVPMTISIVEAYNIFNKVWDNYGERARQAATNEGIDWKAMSHAVRVAEQAIELLRTGKITFPRPNADVLLEIKQGKIAYKPVSDLLELLVSMVQEQSLVSHLPEKSDHKLADRTVLQLYLGQVK